jgi:hypothetical protein
MMLASECRMSKRRVMAKSKVYGFSPWLDQVDAINQTMKDIGEETSHPFSGNLLMKHSTPDGSNADQFPSSTNQMPA